MGVVFHQLKFQPGENVKCFIERSSLSKGYKCMHYKYYTCNITNTSSICTSMHICCIKKKTEEERGGVKGRQGKR